MSFEAIYIVLLKDAKCDYVYVCELIKIVKSLSKSLRYHRFQIGKGWNQKYKITRLTRRVNPSGARSSSPAFSGDRDTRSLVLYVCFVDRCLYFYFRPLCCLFFFDLRIMITSLVSSNSSYKYVRGPS
jgi:hypothetical protein